MSNERCALVTGVGRRGGIGAAIALALAQDGWDLALSYWHPYDDRIGLGRQPAEIGLGGQPVEIGLGRHPAEIDELASELRGLGRRVELLPSDLEDPKSAEELVRRTTERLGGSISGLVLSHCESVDSGFLDTTVESFDRHYAVNVRSSWQLIAAFARQLPAGGGSVIALTSDHTIGNLPYGATKGALDRLVLASAHELSGRGLRANVVNPGPVDNGWMDDATRTSLLALQPTGRLGTPTDTANLVRFLLSEQGEWINGQLLYSNGGFPNGRV